MRIVKLSVENFKRLRAVEIEPGDRTMIRVTGKNSQGKTSLLDSIAVVFGGNALLESPPIRKGAEFAEVSATFGEFEVVRRWTRGGSHSLKLSNASGSVKNPQAALDALFSQISFDPFAFTRLKKQDQIEQLIAASGLKEPLAAIDADLDKAIEARRNANSLASQAEIRFRAAPVVPKETPDEPVSVDELLAIHKEESRAVSEVEDRKRAVEIARTRVSASNQRKTEAQAKIRRLLDEAESLRKDVEELDAAIRESETWIVQEAQAILDTKVPDPNATSDKISAAGKVNENVRLKKDRQAKEKALAVANSQAKDREREVEDLREKREALIAGSKLPVDGLSWDPDGLRLRGIPFSEVSSSEKLETSVAVGLAQNPELKVMLVRDGSLLDDEGLGELAAVAEKFDVQLWVECTTNGEAVGVVIEDGGIREIVDVES